MQVANFFSERVERHQEMKLPNSRSLELSRRQTSCFTFCNGGGFRFGIFDTCPGKKLIYTRRDRREFLSQHVGTVCVFINFFRFVFFSREFIFGGAAAIWRIKFNRKPDLEGCGMTPTATALV
jgi:hypothetical protein